MICFTRAVSLVGISLIYVHYVHNAHINASLSVRNATPSCARMHHHCTTRTRTLCMQTYKHYIRPLALCCFGSLHTCIRSTCTHAHVLARTYFLAPNTIALIFITFPTRRKQGTPSKICSLCINDAPLSYPTSHVAFHVHEHASFSGLSHP